jgi:translation initiation factor 1
MSDKRLSATRSVYSTEHGRLCADCGHPIQQCQCKALERAAQKPAGKLHIRRETKGRKGKGVTVIDGLSLDDAALEQLAKALRQHCGVGGTSKPGLIELQGDQQEKARAFLVRQGLLKAK